MAQSNERAILVKSCQRFKNRRNACENTWVRDIRKAGVSVWFLEGGHKENRISATTLYVCSGDHYTDNSYKLREAYQAVQDFEFVFVCDDDTFVHPERWLSHEPSGDIECRVFYPKLPQDLRRNHGKPWVSGGSGWWCSKRLRKWYVEECVENVSWDDIIIARVAQHHRIVMTDRPDLYGGDRYSGFTPPERVLPSNNLITCHHVSPKEMEELYHAGKAICSVL